MIREAYISGQINKAIFKKDEDHFILEKVLNSDTYRSYPLSLMDMNSFLLSDTEIKKLTGIAWDENTLHKELEEDYTKQEALDLFLISLDTSIDDDLRKEAMDILGDSIFEKPAVQQFVKNRVFGTTIPKGFDPLSALHIAEQLDNKDLAHWYKDLSDAKEIIPFVRNAWKTALLDETHLKVSLGALDKEFTDRGIFAHIVFAALKHNERAFDIIIDSKLIQDLHIAQPAVFLARIKQEVAKYFSFLDDNNKYRNLELNREEDETWESDKQQTFEETLTELINNFSGRTQKKLNNKKGEKTKLFRPGSFRDDYSILDQVAWIKDKINSGYILHAENGILKLIEYQDINSDPEHLCKSLSDIAECYQKNNQIERADLIAYKAMDLNSEDPVPYNIISENLRANDKLDEALKFYELTIQKFGNDVFAYCGKAEILRDLGRLNEALIQYELTILNFRNDPVAFNGRAETLRDLGRPDDALKQYELTILNFTDDVVAYCGKAETLRHLGLLQLALDQYEITVEKFSDNSIAYNGKAETLRELGQLKEALQLYELSVKKFSNDSVGYCGLAETQRELGNVEEALHLYNNILKLFPGNEIAKSGRLTLMVQSGINLHKIKNQINTTNPQTYNEWINYHIYCMLLLKQGKLKEAIDKLEYGLKKIQNIRERQYFSNALSFALIKEKQFKKAIRNLKQTGLLTPINKILITHAYAAERNIHDAKKYFSEINHSPIKKITEVSKYLSDRFHLSNNTFFLGKSNSDLDKAIENLEFELLSISYARKAA